MATPVPSPGPGVLLPGHTPAQQAQLNQPDQPNAPTTNLRIHPSQPFSAPIPGIIPFGTITLFIGLSGGGKTCMLASWFRRWRDGKSICGHPTNRPTGLGVVASDRSLESHRHWFDLAGYPEIPMYSLRDDPKLDWDKFKLPHELPIQFEIAIDRLALPPGALILFDPLAMFIQGNLLDYKQTAIGIALLDRVCKRKKITALGIQHMGKPKGDIKERYLRPQDRILGSAALGAFTDTQIALSVPAETGEDFYTLAWTPHTAPAEEFRFDRDDNGLFVPHLPSPAEQIHQLGILQMLESAGDARPAKEILVWCEEQLQISRATVYRALTELQAAGCVSNPKRGVYQFVKPRVFRTAETTE